MSGSVSEPAKGTHPPLPRHLQTVVCSNSSCIEECALASRLCTKNGNRDSSSGAGEIKGGGTIGEGAWGPKPTQTKKRRGKADRSASPRPHHPPTRPRTSSHLSPTLLPRSPYCFCPWWPHVSAVASRTSTSASPTFLLASARQLPPAPDRPPPDGTAQGPSTRRWRAKPHGRDHPPGDGCPTAGSCERAPQQWCVLSSFPLSGQPSS